MVGRGRAASAIVPVLIGSEGRAMDVSKRLWAEGFFVPAIRYPTVAKGAARLRITVTTGHTREPLQGLVSAIERSLREV